MEINKDMLDKANHKLKHASVEKVLEWTFETFQDDVAITTAFGYSGMALLHHAIKINPDLKVYFIDTGFHFKETLQFCERVTESMNLNIEVFKPEINKRQLKRKLGEEPYHTNADLCCHYNKVEPLLRFIHNQDVWLSGIRRDQSNTRADIEVIELDGRGLVKVSPFCRWSKKKTWKYIHENNVPYHPLHDKGYPSVGCEPCTHPVTEGGDERDGRWPFMQKLECGIHLHNSK